MKADLVKRANEELGGSYDRTGAYWRDAHLEHGYGEYGAVKMISVIAY